jgi:2-dehydropantoate 2-reductase
MADTIHILGLGGVGVLVAHSLAGVTNRPRLNLMLHRPKEYHPPSLAITRNGVTEYQTDFDFESYQDGCWYRELPGSSVEPMEHSQSQSVLCNEAPIHVLIVAVKAHHTIHSIQLVKHRLSRHSTILFLQNGLGSLDELDTELFPNASVRPYYMSAVVTHCIRRNKFFSATHTAMGSISLGSSPRTTEAFKASMSLKAPPGADGLVSLFKRAYYLNAAVRSPQELLQQQLNKLVTNSVHNPLTSLLDCSIEGLITSTNPLVQATSDALVCEFSDIIKALPLSGLISKEDLETEFSAAKLKTTINQIGQRAGAHTTSMLQDLRNGEQTEIMYLNGCFMRWAVDLGIDCPVNKIIIRKVLEKESKADKIMLHQNAGPPDVLDDLMKGNLLSTTGVETTQV